MRRLRAVRERVERLMTVGTRLIGEDPDFRRDETLDNGSSFVAPSRRTQKESIRTKTLALFKKKLLFAYKK